MSALNKVNKQLSKFKWKRLAVESLVNSLRLIHDARLLFNANSYPSAYQLAVLSLEELSKACWIDHYYYSAITNTGFPPVEFEQEFLKLLYLHGKKQSAFITPNQFEYPVALVELIKSGGLERRKQQAVYVGLDRDRKAVHVDGRISVPRKTISQLETKKFVSWVISELVFRMDRLEESGVYFGIPGMDEILKGQEAAILRHWPHLSRTRSRRHWNAHVEKHKEAIEAAAREYCLRNANSLSAPTGK